MWTIRETPDGWVLARADGTVEATEPSYDRVLAKLGALLADANGDAAPSADGLLPEVWEDVAGICFSQATGDGRDFTECTWTSRDPAKSVLPLMLQTETEIGHFGAKLAGYIESIDGLGAGTTPKARGRFYDSEVGRQFRDMLLDGRRFGVSVDNGDVDYEWICVNFDEQAGWCIEETMNFLAYEIIGLTGTPFPAFAEAAIQLAGAATDAPPADAPPAEDTAPPAQAASAFPAVPPRSWFEFPEPQLGDPLLVAQLDDVDDADQVWAVPLTITDEGHVFGHLAWWGQCHVGFPGQCIQPPHSPTAYRRFNLRSLPVDGGGTVLTGPLVVGAEHYDRHVFSQATDHTAHVDLAWADVHASDGQFGPWITGAVRPGITPEQLRVLRASSVSGEWYDEDGRGLDLTLGLTVSGPGYPIRAEALAASGLRPKALRPRARIQNGRVVSLAAANVVRRECPTCSGNSREKAVQGDLAAIQQAVELIERRTRHLIPEAGRYAASRIRRG